MHSHTKAWFGVRWRGADRSISAIARCLYVRVGLYAIAMTHPARDGRFLVTQIRIHTSRPCTPVRYPDWRYVTALSDSRRRDIQPMAAEEIPRNA